MQYYIFLTGDRYEESLNAKQCLCYYYVKRRSEIQNYMYPHLKIIFGMRQK